MDPRASAAQRRRNARVLRVIFPLLLAALLLCSSCARVPSLTGGRTPDGELLDAVSEAVFAPGSAYDVSQPLPLPPDTVCWTPNGSVYHAFSDCSHLDRVSALLTGSPEGARREGKEKLCSACAARRAEGKDDPYAQP